MTTYIVVEGDSFERISRLSYGSDELANVIKSANPQAAGGLSPGMTLTIPAVDVLPGPLVPQTIAGRQNEVSISINGEVFRFWETMQLQRSIDSFDTFMLDAPFEPTNQVFVDAFTPLGYNRVVINVDGDPLFSGFLVDVPTDVGPTEGTVQATGYALAGLLNDSMMPNTAYPVEFDNMDLRDITLSLIKPFGLTATFTSDPGPQIDRIAIEEPTKVLRFLINGAQQRGLVIGNDVRGMPVFQKAAAGAPVENLVQGESPVTNVTNNFNPQKFYSHVTALTPATIGNDGSAFTVENPHLRGVVRPFVFRAVDTFGADAAEAARAKAGFMFANALSYTVNVAGWETRNGLRWAENQRVNLLAPRAMVYSNFEFLIRSVTLFRDANEDRAALELVLPGSFEGVIPERLPWQ
ncbi:MAG: hypothetical protein V3W41_14485 [Planctomycetota bacterium]